MSKFSSEYVVKNDLEGVYASIFGSQVCLPETNIDLLILINISANKHQKELSIVNKYISDDLLAFASAEISAGRENMDVLEKIQTRLEYVVNNVLEKDPELAETGIDINMVFVILEESYFYIYTFGEVLAYLKRADKLISISDLLNQESRLTHVKIGSMHLQESDRLVLAIFVDDQKKEFVSRLLETLNTLDLKSLSESKSFVSICLANSDDAWPANVESQEELKITEDNSDNLSDDDYVNVNNVESQDKYPLDSDKITEKTVTEAQKDSFTSFFSNYVNNIKSIFVDLATRIRFFAENFSKNDVSNSNEKSLGSLHDHKLKIQNSIRSKYFVYLQSKLRLFLSKNLVNIRNLLFVPQDINPKSRIRYKQIVVRNRFVLAVIIIVLSVYIYNSYQYAENQRKEFLYKEKVTNDLKKIRDKFNLVKSQVIQGNNDLSDARRSAILSELSNISNELDINKDIKILFPNEKISLSNDILELNDLVKKIIKLTDVNIIADISIHHSDANLSSMVVVNDNVFISDTNRSVIYRLPIQGTGVIPQTFVTGLVQPYLLVQEPDGNIIFFDNDKNSCIGRISSTQENILTRFQGLTLSDVGKVNSASIFKNNGFLYEIRNINNQIFKRNKTGNSFANGGAIPTTDNTNWLTDNRLSSAIDIKTPFSIYVLSRGHGLLRFLSGQDTNLNFDMFEGLSKDDYEILKQSDAFDIVDDLLVVANSKLRRLMVFQRKGDEINFQGFKFIQNYEYRGDKNLMSNIIKLSIIPNTKKVVILDGTRILSLSV